MGFALRVGEQRESGGVRLCRAGVACFLSLDEHAENERGFCDENADGEGDESDGLCAWSIW